MCALLAIVLQPDQPKAPYSPKITHYLLERKLVRDSMLDGGILKPLRDRSDWVCVRLTTHSYATKSILPAWRGTRNSERERHP